MKQPCCQICFWLVSVWGESRSFSRTSCLHNYLLVERRIWTVFHPQVLIPSPAWIFLCQMTFTRQLWCLWVPRPFFWPSLREVANNDWRSWFFRIDIDVGSRLQPAIWRWRRPLAVWCGPPCIFYPSSISLGRRLGRTPPVPSKDNSSGCSVKTCVCPKLQSQTADQSDL